MFIIDILINFRTTYVCENDEVISQVSERQILLLEGGCVDSTGLGLKTGARLR